MNKYIAYTDGSAIGNNSSNPGPAGFAAKFLGGDLHVGSFPGTNNEAEIAAVILAVKNCPSNSKLEIRTDSAIALGVLGGSWRTEVPTLQNLRYWYNELLLAKNIVVNFVKVKGHSHDEYNNVVDRESKRRARELRSLAPELRYV